MHEGVGSTRRGRLDGSRGEDCPNVTRRAMCQGEPARQPVRTVSQASEISRDDPELDPRISVRPGGGLFQVGQGQVPPAEPHLGPGAAQVGFGELRVAPEGQRPLQNRRIDETARRQCLALYEDGCGRRPRIRAPDCSPGGRGSGRRPPPTVRRGARADPAR